MEEEDEEGECYGADPPLSPTEDVNTEVSLNSVVGLSNPKTMKVRGLIGNIGVVVLIDPGATHNFLSTSVIQSGKIPVTAAGSFSVALGNRETTGGRLMQGNLCAIEWGLGGSGRLPTAGVG